MPLILVNVRSRLTSRSDAGLGLRDASVLLLAE